eukprot:Filipodium_phascolosomae@DN8015_c0_g1_i1.p1
MDLRFGRGTGGAFIPSESDIKRVKEKLNAEKKLKEQREQDALQVAKEKAQEAELAKKLAVETDEREKQAEEALKIDQETVVKKLQQLDTSISADLLAVLTTKWLKEIKSALNSTSKNEVEDVIARAKIDLKGSPQLVNEKPKYSSEWSEEDIRNLYKALKKFPSGVTLRWKLISDFVGTHNEQQVVDKVKDLSKRQSTTENKPSDFEKFKSENSNALKKITVLPDEVTDLSLTEISLTDPNETGEDDAWTKDQQDCLEKALTQFPSSLPPGVRWNHIAEMVAGKSKKECISRFKQIRDALKAQRSSS